MEASGLDEKEAGREVMEASWYRSYSGTQRPGGGFGSWSYVMEEDTKSFRPKVNIIWFELESINLVSTYLESQNGLWISSILHSLNRQFSENLYR